MRTYIQIMTVLILLASISTHYHTTTHKNKIFEYYSTYCGKSIENIDAHSVTKFVKFHKHEMIITANNGKILTYASHLDGEDPPASIDIRCISHFDTDNNILFISWDDGDYGGYDVVSLEDGSRMYYEGSLIFSPDKKLLIHFPGSYPHYDGPAIFQIFHPSRCGLVQEFIVQTPPHSPAIDFIWSDSNTIQIQYIAKNKLQIFDKIVATVEKTEKGWTFHPTPLWSKIMNH